ncbi:MAG TPA: hypothetical protein VK348_05845 [Planctomycetota bacterium]|nr:hypothetical protein [Planctomycetota bacterium]
MAGRDHKSRTAGSDRVPVPAQHADPTDRPHAGGVVGTSHAEHRALQDLVTAAKERERRQRRRRSLAAFLAAAGLPADAELELHTDPATGVVRVRILDADGNVLRELQPLEVTALLQQLRRVDASLVDRQA